MTTDPSLTNLLKVERAKRNLTQAQLASMAGITRRSVNAIETGRMVPSILLALRIARALDVSVESIFALDDTSDLQRPSRVHIPS
jgi:putative transcriptional regulator